MVLLCEIFNINHHKTMSLEGVPNQKKYTAETPTIEATNFEVIDVEGKPMRVAGYTGPEGSNGRMKVLEDITAKDIQDNLTEQQAEQKAHDHVMRMKENNPLVDVDKEIAFWTRAFKSGPKMEADINEAYAKKTENHLANLRGEMLRLEEGLNSAKTDEERKAGFKRIEELRDEMVRWQKEIDYRRGKKI